MDFQINPGVGFDQIKFGMTREQVLEILGNPSEIREDENYSGDPKETEDLTTVFDYDDLGVSFSFDKIEDYRLVEIDFDSPDFSLGPIHVGNLIDSVFSDAEVMKLGEAEEDYLDDEDNPDNLKSFTFFDTNVTVWFEKDILTTIQLGPFWKDDDTIDWPE